jgi:hypothetical protein
MPIPFKGVINGEVLSPVYNLPFKITSIKIANLNAGSTVLNFSVTDGVNDIYLAPQNYTQDEGDMWQDSITELMPAGNQIKISTNALVSYYITIENITSE